MKIRTRAFLIIIIANVFIIIFSILAGTGYARTKIEDYINTDMLIVADIADHYISTEIALLKLKAEHAANELSSLKEADWPGAFSKNMIQDAQFIGMSVLDINNGAIASAGHMPAGPDLLEDKYIRQAFFGDTIFTSTVQTGNGIMIYLAAPIPGENNQILAITIDGLFFTDSVADFAVWDTGHIYMVDNDGYLLANYRRNWMQERANFLIWEQTDPEFESVAATVRRMINGEKGIGYYTISGIPRICAFMPLTGSNENWALGVVAPLNESPIRNIDMGLLMICVIGLILNIIAAIIGSRFIKKPFEEAAALKDEAEANSQEKSRFLAIMSHEIRTLMNAVIGFSEILLSNCEDDGRCAGCVEDLKKVNTASHTLLSIINDILDISKIESGKQALVPEEYDLASFINDTIMLNSVRIGEKPVILKLDIDDTLPARLFGDSLRVKQICNNLLSNAIKYTEEGSVTWHINCNREPGSDLVWMTFTVRDTGIGILEEDMDKLFSEYSQVDSKSTRNIEGTGLGLPLSVKLAEMMGGKITAESEFGKGSVFTATIQQNYINDSTIGQEVANSLRNFVYTDNKRSSSSTLRRIKLPGVRILLVDDMRVNLEVARGLMKPYGMKIDCVASGADAIAAVKRAGSRYDAIFMDHMMPGMDGVETTRIIREEIDVAYAKTVPIIMLTADAIIGNEEKFISMGFQAFLAKPIDIIRLDNIIKRWIRDTKSDSQYNEIGLNGEDNADSVSYVGGEDDVRHSLGGADANIETEYGAATDSALAIKSTVTSDSSMVIKGAVALDNTMVDYSNNISVSNRSTNNNNNNTGFGRINPATWRIEGVNIAKLLKRLGDEQIVMLLLRTFIEDTPTMLGKMRNVHPDSIQEYIITVHGLKGSCYDICVESLGIRAEKLEFAAKSGRFDIIKAQNNRFIEDVEELLGELQCHMQSAAGNEIRKTPDPKLLANILKASRNFDIDGVESFLTELELYEYETGEDLIHWLRETFKVMGFKNMTQRLSQILGDDSASDIDATNYKQNA